MSDDDAAVLGELLCARLCHDLAGAIGAIGTGVELLSDDDAAEGLAADALDLLSGSASAAVSRLKFLRIALGRGGAAMSSGQLRQLIGDFFGSQTDGSGALRLDWREVNRPDWGGDDAKLLLNIILLARDCLPSGGVVTVEPLAEGQTMPVVIAEGARAATAEAVAALKAENVALLRPRGAQGYYTRLLAQRMELLINYEDSHSRVVFVAIKN
jgi:histidine phosphotransferase ChpT